MLFPVYNELMEKKRTKLIENSKVKVIVSEKREFPLFRYIPSREVMQRIIMRATLLPKDFQGFSEDE